MGFCLGVYVVPMLNLPTFINEPYTDFTIQENIDAYNDAIKRMRDSFGQTHKLCIGGEWVDSETGETFASTNPSDPNEVIGYFSKANENDAEKCMVAAKGAFQIWSKKSPEDRAQVLLNAAALMRERKHDFSAMMSLEEGKNWPEADGDTAESIDFLEFYAREIIRYSNKSGDVTPSPVGDHNWIRYFPLGVGVIIPPWNFPNAILAGMTTAAVVCGNTVILKPSSDAPMIGLMVFNLLVEAGLPPGVCNWLTGPGAVAGDYLVNHPDTRFISFTGSMEVGCKIYESASKLNGNQKWLKRVVAEMGGKDAMLIDRDADLELASSHIVAAAYGYQGQKCSACSRALIHQDIYDELVPMIIEKTKAIKISSAEENPNMGPLINKSSLNKCREYIEIGKQEGELLLGGNSIELNGGWFLEPTIFGGISPGDRLEQEEIFGPILALVKVNSYRHGVEVFNGTIFGLTGSYVGTEHLNDAPNDLHCGNLYINRKCTGALVDVEPFGGYNMSGTCSKAGGRDYLGLFMQMKAVSERPLTK